MQFRDVQPGIAQNVSDYFPRDKLLSALNDSKVGVVICDRRMRYKALNKTVAEIHNVPIEAHLGHCFHEIIGHMADKVIPLWENVFVTGQPSPSLEVTGRLLKRSETGRWIENLFPLKDDRGRVAQVGCFVIEIPSSPAPRCRDAGWRSSVACGPFVIQRRANYESAPVSQRAGCRSTHCGRKIEQGNCVCPRHQCEDRRDLPGQADAEARRNICRASRALCDSQSHYYDLKSRGDPPRLLRNFFNAQAAFHTSQSHPFCR